jgi:hypothetical protein
MKIFFDGMDQENSKTQEGKNGGKKKRWRFPYSCVLHQLGTPSGYRSCATLPCMGTSATTK